MNSRSEVRGALGSLGNGVKAGESPSPKQERLLCSGTSVSSLPEVTFILQSEVSFHAPLVQRP